MTSSVDTFLKGTAQTLKEQAKDIDVYLPITLTFDDYRMVLNDEGHVDLKKFYSRCILKAAETYQKGQNGSAIYTSQTKEYRRRTERAFNQFIRVNPETGEKQYLCIVLVRPEGEQSKIHGQNKRSRGLTPNMIKNLANKFHGVILDDEFPGRNEIIEES